MGVQPTVTVRLDTGTLSTVLRLTLPPECMKPSTAAWVVSDSVAEKQTVYALLMEAICIDLRLSNIAIKKFGLKQSIAGHATLGALKYNVRAFSICT